MRISSVVIIPSIVASLLAVGCGGDTNPGGQGGGMPFTPPASVQVDIVSALIAPAKADGSCWDGVGCSIDQETRDKVAKALIETGDPYAVALGVGAALSGLAQGAYGPPDPLAVAKVWRDGKWDAPFDLATRDSNDEDSFTPTWHGDPAQGGAVGFQVPFNQDFRVHVSVSDEDLTSDDPIGDVDINYDHVIAALQANKTYPVRVADQGSGLVLFVHIDAHGF